ncbi:MAG: response regulator [Lewinellaceae bacterium]|nr:response regulator [Lewinellaceae bacterium]
MVKSQEAVGTVFTVLLPVRKNAAVRQPGSPAAERNVHMETSGQNAVHEKDTLNTAEPEPDELDRLLLIEDNRDVAAYLISILEKDYQVVTAEDGQAGIEKALELIPDIIISDVMMPRKDGFEVCRALKLDERTSHIPIILLTAKAEEEAKIQGLKTGADAYLMKPFNREELFVRLEKLLELRKQLQKKYAQAGTTSTADSPPSTTEPTLDDLFMQKFQQAIEKNMGQADFGIDGLCKMLSMSRTQLYRKAKALTGESPARFIQKVQLNKARELLQTTELNVSEIAYEVGFTDPAYFSRAFNKEFGAPPSSLRK